MVGIISGDLRLPRKKTRGFLLLFFTTTMLTRASHICRAPRPSHDEPGMPVERVLKKKKNWATDTRSTATHRMGESKSRGARAPSSCWLKAKAGVASVSLPNADIGQGSPLRMRWPVGSDACEPSWSGKSTNSARETAGFRSSERDSKNRFHSKDDGAEVLDANVLAQLFDGSRIMVEALKAE